MRNATVHYAATLATGVFVGMAIGMPVGAYLAPSTHDIAAPAVHLATITEDDPAWNCITDGNRVCGPANTNDVAPGCYDDAGSLVAPWPCHVIGDLRTGEADVFTGPANDPAATTGPGRVFCADLIALTGCERV
jgi:hypothetical protein